MPPDAVGDDSEPSTRVTVRMWLVANGYELVDEMIGEVMAAWAAEAKGTRRNWWLVLAGGKNGSPRTIGGICFPVLRTAQIRQGLEVTPNAVCLSLEEVPPPITPQERWKRNRRRRRRAA